jgi:hypothetical protein
VVQEPSVWIELAKAIPSSVTAITAVVGVVIAARGLNRWRAETIGKRKAELTEEVLADFYQARDIINAARSPGSFGYEGATRQKADWESEDDTRTLNSYFVTIERLNKKHEFFAQLHARRYRFIAHFGLEAAKPYDDLFDIRAEVISAVQMLIMTYRDRDQGSPPSDRAKLQDVIWDRHNKADPIPGKLDRIVEAIENISRPAIQEAAR